MSHVILAPGSNITVSGPTNSATGQYASSAKMKQFEERRRSKNSFQPNLNQFSGNPQSNTKQGLTLQRHYGNTNRDRSVDLSAARNQEATEEPTITKFVTLGKKSSDAEWIAYLSEKYDLKPLFKIPKQEVKFSNPDYQRILVANSGYEKKFAELIKACDDQGKFSPEALKELHKLYVLGFIRPLKFDHAKAYQSLLTKFEKEIRPERLDINRLRAIYWTCGGEKSSPDLTELKKFFKSIEFTLPEILTRERKHSKLDRTSIGGTRYKTRANKANSQNMPLVLQSKRRGRIIHTLARYGQEAVDWFRDNKGITIKLGDPLPPVRRTSKSVLARANIFQNIKGNYRYHEDEDLERANARPTKEASSSEGTSISDEQWHCDFQTVGLTQSTGNALTEGVPGNDDLLRGLESLVRGRNLQQKIKLLLEFVLRDKQVTIPEIRWAESGDKYVSDLWVMNHWSDIMSGRKGFTKMQVEFLQAAYRLGYMSIPSDEPRVMPKVNVSRLKPGLGEARATTGVQTLFHQPIS